MKHISSFLKLAAVTLAALLCVSVSPALADGSNDGKNRVVTVFNDTQTPIYYFYASRIDIDDWEEDILDEDVLMPDDSVRINIDDGSGGCRYDVKVKFKDDVEVIEKDINVCAVLELHVFRNEIKAVFP